MYMSSQRYINAASEYKYICILIHNTFCSATFYNDHPMITHAVAQELGPQEVMDSSWEFVWASSFILVEIFQLFNYAVCANIKGVCWSTIKYLLPEWGNFRW